MTNPEINNEHLNDPLQESPEFAIDLTYLESNTKSKGLQREIKKHKPWEFYIANNQNKDFIIYGYIVKEKWTPWIIRNQAIRKRKASSKEWILITDRDWVKYDESHKFSAWDKVYLKIPKAEKASYQNQSIGNNTNYEISETHKPWEFYYENSSNDWQYKVYSYTLETDLSNWSIINKAQKNLNLKDSRWIKITDKDWFEINNSHKTGEKIYIKIPNENFKSNRDNKDYFDNSQKVETDNIYQNKWIILKRDVWMSFYVMQAKDIQGYSEVKDKKWKVIDIKWDRVATINYLREKLWAVPEFAYLKRDEYAPKNENGNRVFTQTFNIRGDFAAQTKNNPGRYFIPIPLDSNVRKFEDKEFKDYAKIWVDELCKTNEPYWKYWAWINRSKLAKFITTIAKVETWKTNKRIWTDEYHRWEEWNHNCFSFWPHHVLMEWPWKTAFNTLKDAWYFSTEWQTYHPKNSTMRCMWFIVEKLKNMGHKNITKSINNMLSFFNKKNVTGADFRAFARMYNGKSYERNNYHNKFAQAYNSIGE